MKNEFPILKTNNLLLRQFSENDLENIFKGLSHPDIIKYYGVSYHSLEDTKQQLIYFADLEKNETGVWWAICSLNTNQFYGAIGLNDLKKEHKKAEIGFWLLTEFWGKGIINEAITIVCNYGFNNLNLHRIEAIVESENNNSKKLLEKNKFQYEGTLRECELKNEKYISLDYYSILN